MTAAAEVRLLPSGGGTAPRLSGQQLQVLQWRAEGLTNAQIARRLGITVRGLSRTLQHILTKLGAKTIAHAVHIANALDLLQPPVVVGGVVIRPLLLLQSLIASGWTVSALAERMGMQQSELSQLMRREDWTDLMTVRVQQVFLRLQYVDPLDNGVTRQGVSRSLNLARQMGWKVVPADEVAGLMAAYHHAA